MVNIDMDEAVSISFDLCQDMVSCLRNSFGHFTHNRLRNLSASRELKTKEVAVFFHKFNRYPPDKAVVSINWVNDMEVFEFENKFIEHCMPHVLMALGSPSSLNLEVRGKVLKNVWQKESGLLSSYFEKNVQTLSEKMHSGSVEDFREVLNKATWCPPSLEVPLSSLTSDFTDYFKVLSEQYLFQINACELACHAHEASLRKPMSLR